MTRLVPTLLLVVLLITIAVSELKSQDIFFSQPFNNKIYVNPAFTGLDNGFRAHFNVRNYYPKISDELVNYTFTADIAERDLPGAGGLGIFAAATSGGLGFIKTTIAGFTGSVRVPLQRHLVSQLGFMTSYVTRSAEWEDYVWGDQLDPKLGYIDGTAFSPPSDNKVTYPDISLGGLLSYKKRNIKLNFGGALHHVLKPDESFFGNDVRIPWKITGHLDMVVIQQRDQKNGFKFNPGMFFENHRGFNSLVVGTNAYKSSLYVGAWYRNQQSDLIQPSAMIVMAGINVPMLDDSRFKIMYSYDLMLGEPKGTGGAHEVTLRVEFDSFSIFNSQSAYFRNYPLLQQPLVF